MTEHLGVALLNLAVEIAAASEDSIREDFAVHLLEQLATDLKKLAPHDLEVLKQTADRLASTAANPATASALREVLPNLGLK